MAYLLPAYELAFGCHLDTSMGLLVAKRWVCKFSAAHDSCAGW